MAGHEHRPRRGGEPAVTPSDAAPPQRVIEQLQRLADRAVGSRRRGGHLIVRMESADASWRWAPTATGADASAEHLDAGRVKVRYSDGNYQLLGAILEATTGVAFAAALQAELLDPLGLHHTWVAGSDGAAQHPEPAPIQASGRRLDLPLAFGSMGPDGGLIGTTADAIGFLRALHADPEGPLVTMTAGTFDNPAAGAPYRIVPALVRTYSG